ncbi:MAG: hypothetical protein JWL69_3317 [Phycisphaerales bacterium]|nr:hypothetical protein [Phycisphaerales bacterium]MDB5355753.1 hypothetical protein [Phycisphaerales bacterium]
MNGIFNAPRVKLIVAGIGACLLQAPMGCSPQVEGNSVQRPGAQADKPKANPPSATPPGPATAPGTVDYRNDKQGIRLQYPSDWSPKEDKDFVLKLVPGGHDEGRRITFDVPDIPPHIPGMITLGRIEKGYLDDLKKDHPGLKVEESEDAAVPGGKGRLVRSTWSDKKEAKSDVALLIMRGEHVYILAADTNTADFDAVKATFDAIAKSLRWTK